MLVWQCAVPRNTELNQHYQRKLIMYKKKMHFLDQISALYADSTNINMVVECVNSLGSLEHDIDIKCTFL
jgi:hypothetical protein